MNLLGPTIFCGHSDPSDGVQNLLFGVSSFLLHSIFLLDSQPERLRRNPISNEIRGLHRRITNQKTHYESDDRKHGIFLHYL